jgi:hypothetical protein
MSTTSMSWMLLVLTPSSAPTAPSLTSSSSVPGEAAKLQRARAQSFLILRRADMERDTTAPTAPCVSIATRVSGDDARELNAAAQESCVCLSGCRDSFTRVRMAPSSTMPMRLAGFDASVASEMAKRRFLSRRCRFCKHASEASTRKGERGEGGGRGRGGWQSEQRAREAARFRQKSEPASAGEAHVSLRPLPPRKGSAFALPPCTLPTLLTLASLPRLSLRSSSSPLSSSSSIFSRRFRSSSATSICFLGSSFTFILDRYIRPEEWSP